MSVLLMDVKPTGKAVISRTEMDFACLELLLVILLLTLRPVVMLMSPTPRSFI